MAITPIDIQQKQFKSRPFGYEKSGVDHFLELIAEEMERLFKVSQELKEELALNRAALEEMRGREEMLKSTLLATQQMIEDMKANARREAEIIVTDAELRGEKIVREAEARRIQLIGEIQEVKRQKISFETSLRSLVENHMRLLDLDVVALEDSSAAGERYGDQFSLEEGIRDLGPEDEVLEDEILEDEI